MTFSINLKMQSCYLSGWVTLLDFSCNFKTYSQTKRITKPTSYKDLDYLVKFISKRTDCNSEHFRFKKKKKGILAISEIWAFKSTYSKQTSSCTSSKCPICNNRQENLRIRQIQFLSRAISWIFLQAHIRSTTNINQL